MYREALFALALIALACSTPAPQPEAAAEAPPAIPTQQAELLATDGSWGNTEGPAVDSAGALYFTSRGTYKGIVKWTKDGGAQQYARLRQPGQAACGSTGTTTSISPPPMSAKSKSAPDGTVTTIAKGFEADPAM
ncbi:MAG: hypothetical protein R2748_22315 [Bryobacterales bacterium]